MSVMTAEARAALIKEYATKPGDTGSPEVQVALISARVAMLTEHLKAHPKDFHSRRGLLVLVGQRRGLLDYVKKKDVKQKIRSLKKHSWKNWSRWS